MLRLQSATRAAQAPGPRVAVPGRGGLRALICCIALAVGWLLVAPASGLANPITDENAQAGSTGWERSQADAPRIEAYTSKTSVAPGEIIGFHVSTNPQASYRVIIYRLGWYGGAGARQMTCIPGCSSSNSGVTNSTPNPNAQTGEIDANWTQSASLTIPSNWTTGEYVAEYVLTSGPQSGLARYSPFVVRSNTPQASASNILVVVPLNSYLAYNNWGGTSAYENNTNKSIFNLDHATKVSFNRPFHRRDWRFWDLPLLRFLEREGYDVSYVSDADVDANPNILLQHRAVLVSGHSEYWTKNMRDGFEAARDAATNIAFIGANDAYWQVRYEDSSCPDDNTDGLIAIAARTQPPHGNVLITGGGSGLTYQPDPGYCNTPPASAPDIFTYTLNGGDAATVSAAVICSPVSAPQRETSPATKTKCNRKSKYSKKARKKCRKKRRHGK